MITLEQIRLLESKITRAIELIRVLKEENATLRKGLESAQKRMKELESLVDGFKADQREIESVIVRTLHTLDELEESAFSMKKGEHAGAGVPAAGGQSAPAARSETPKAAPERRTPAEAPAAPQGPNLTQPPLPGEDEPRAAEEELDIF
jgi:TolA-binding protein